MADSQNNKHELHKLELLDFFASWCEPCKILDEILEKVSNNMGNHLKISKIDIDQEPLLRQRYQVSSVPVLILLKGGKTVWRMNGFLTAPELVRIFRDFV